VFATEVSFIGRHVADRTVAMCAVVPVDKPGHPALRGADVGERQTRVCGNVFERSKERFGVRIVVGDMRSTKGRHDTEPLKCRDHGVAAHRRTIVRVKHKTLGIKISIAARSPNELGRNVSRLSGSDLPANDTTAPNVHNQVEMEVRTTPDCRESGDVPAPDLVRLSRTMDRARTRHVGATRRSAFDPEPVSTLHAIHC
jgi:hypothetical protein